MTEMKCRREVQREGGSESGIVKRKEDNWKSQQYSLNFNSG